MVSFRGCAGPPPRAIARARFVEAREGHVVDARIGLLPGLLFLERDAADRHDVRLDVPRRAFPAGAAAAAAEIIEQTHLSTRPATACFRPVLLCLDTLPR